jgi:hypothetical protein
VHIAHIAASLALLASLSPLASADVVTGRVVNEQGKPVSGVDLDIQLFAGGNDPPVSGDFTLADGTFSTLVGGGVYTIFFEPPTGSNLFREVRKPVVVAGLTDLGDIVMGRAVTLSGRLESDSGTPVAGANIDVVDLETNLPTPITNDLTLANGSFSLKIPEGLLELQFEAPVGVPLLASVAFEMTVTKNVGLGTVQLVSGRRLSAVVKGPGGQAVVAADTDVRDALTDVKLFTPGDNTSASGAVEVIVPPGDYVFVVQPKITDGLTSISVPVTVNNNDVSLGTLNLATGVVLSGKVSSGGMPLVGIDLDLNEVGTLNSIPLSADNTDALGNYAVVVPTGTWDLIFSPVEGEDFAPSNFSSVSINADMELDVVLLPCPDSCSNPGADSVIPMAGPPAGGNQVTLRGSNFVDDGSTVVRFGGSLASIVSITPPQTIVVTPPAGTKDATVSVTVESSQGSIGLPDSYTYGDMKFELGHRLDGTLPTGDVDRLFVEAVAGAKLNAALKRAPGSTLQPRLRVIGPGGSVLLSAADNETKAVAKKLVLPLTGTYILELSTEAGSVGAYRFTTKVRWPKKAKQTVVIGVQTSTGHLLFGAREGWTLNKAKVNSKKAKTAPLGPIQPSLRLFRPDGSEVDVTGLTKTNKTGFSVSFAGLDLDAFGSWRLQIDAAPGASGQATVSLSRKAPKTPKTTLVEGG